MKNYLTALAALMVIAGCKKEASDLPAATQTGANTFGAMVNGKTWAPQGFGVVHTAPLLEAHYVNAHRDVLINARNFASEPTETEFEIYLQQVTQPGTYWLNSNTAHSPDQSASYGYYIKRKLMPDNEWITNATFTGRVDITYTDTVNHIVSGTFSFDAINMYGNADTLHVTDGRFDV